MNVSKKTIKKPNKKKVNKKSPLNKKYYIIVGAVIILLLTSLVIFDQFHEKTLFTIEKEKYTLDDLRYYFYSVESEGQKMDETYKSLFQTSYWDMPYDQSTGATMRELAKNQVINMIVEYNILYKEAIKNNYSLTDEDKNQVDEKVNKLLNEDLSDTEITKNKFTKEYLEDVIGRIVLADRFRDETIVSFNIDYDAIKEDISFEEYRQYDTEYFTISKNKTDDEGNNIPLTDDEKTLALDKLNDIYEKAKTNDNWSDLLSEDEKEIKYKTLDFIASDNQLSEDIQDTLIQLDNNEITDVLEDDNNYYIFKMIKNDSTNKYDSVIENENQQAENQAFAEYYENISATYDYDVNFNFIRSMRMGNLTID